MFNKVWGPRVSFQGHPQELAVNFKESLEVMRYLGCRSAWQTPHLRWRSGVKEGQYKYSLANKQGQPCSLWREWLGGPPDLPARIWGREWVLATSQGGMQGKVGPLVGRDKPCSAHKTTEIEVRGHLHCLRKHFRDQFKLHVAFPLLLMMQLGCWLLLSNDVIS